MLRFVGLENQAHRRLAELPEGSKRLVELARALASEPRLLLLDEPCAGLNPSEVDMLHQALKSVQAQGVTIFLVEHNMRLVMRIAEKIIVLNFGQKIAEGPPEVVSKDLAVIEAYLGKEHGTVSA
jgi:branched-chain amino acid transport system ATP-binding protein